MAHQCRTAGNARHPEVDQKWFTVRFPAPVYRGEGSPYSGSRSERGRPCRDSVGAILNGDCELRHSNALNDPEAERATLASHEGFLRTPNIIRLPDISKNLFQKGSEAALVWWVQPTDFQGLCRWVAPALQPSNQASETDFDPVGPWHSLALDGNFSQGLHRHGRRSRPGPGPAGMPCSGASSLERSSHLPSRRGPCGQRSGVTGPRADLG